MTHTTMKCLLCISLSLFRVLLVILCAVMLVFPLIQIAQRMTMQNIDKDIANITMSGSAVRLKNNLLVTGHIVAASIGIYCAYTLVTNHIRSFTGSVLANLTLLGAFKRRESPLNNWNKHKGSFQALMNKYAREYQWNLQFNQEANIATKAWDLIQSKLQCCGLAGPEDWPLKWNASDWNVLPKTCCHELLLQTDEQLTATNSTCLMDNLSYSSSGCLCQIHKHIVAATRFTSHASYFNLLLIGLALAMFGLSKLRLKTCYANDTSPSCPESDSSIDVRQASLTNVIIANQTQDDTAFYYDIRADEVPLTLTGQSRECSTPSNK